MRRQPNGHKMVSIPKTCSPSDRTFQPLRHSTERSTVLTDPDRIQTCFYLCINASS
jgi:hypothetical protein